MRRGGTLDLFSFAKRSMTGTRTPYRPQVVRETTRLPPSRTVGRMLPALRYTKGERRKNDPDKENTAACGSENRRRRVVFIRTQEMTENGTVIMSARSFVGNGSTAPEKVAVAAETQTTEKTPKRAPEDQPGFCRRLITQYVNGVKGLMRSSRARPPMGVFGKGAAVRGGNRMRQKARPLLVTVPAVRSDDMVAN